MRRFRAAQAFQVCQHILGGFYMVQIYARYRRIRQYRRICHYRRFRLAAEQGEQFHIPFVVGLEDRELA